MRGFVAISLLLCALSPAAHAGTPSLRGVAGATIGGVKKTVSAGEKFLEHTAGRHPFTTTAVYAPAMFGLGFTLAHTAGARADHAAIAGGLFSLKAVVNVVAAKYWHSHGKKTFEAIKRHVTQR